MCGIVGIVSTKPITERAWIEDGREAIRHRGPNDKGLWWSANGQVGFGHRRLSILDLSERGHQPMHSPDEKISIIFNGEIYNFQQLRHQLKNRGYCFKSNSDTEVILASYAEWGTKCVLHLQGMFAFAIFDDYKKTLFLSRDRAGEKPLFYHQKGGQLRFASELKALLCDDTVSRKISNTSLQYYLSLGYVPREHCIFEEFQKLAPATCLIFNLISGELDTWRYWCVSDGSGDKYAPSDMDECANELESLLTASVKQQLIADVPVGVLLSGGVDSSLITAIAAKSTSQQLKTFTVVFPEHQRVDESKHAKLIAQHFGTQHTELVSQYPTEDVLELLPKQFD